MTNKRRPAPDSPEHLLAMELGGRIPYARGVRADQWLFITGSMATDDLGRLAPNLINTRLPLHGEPKCETEARLLLDRAREVLIAGKSDFRHVIRLDQFFTDWRVVEPYQVVRRESFGAYIPPSTSILEEELLLPGATMDVSMIAIRKDSQLPIEVLTPSELHVPARAGFSPIVCAGDFVFIAGFMAAWKPGDLGGIAPEARVPPGHLWKGTQIKLETEYLIERKLLPALNAAASSPRSVVKAHVYLADINDIPAFNSVWQRYFNSTPPASTIVPTSRPGFAISDATIEINLLAVKEGGAIKKEVIYCTSFAGFAGQPAAVRAGNLLLLSGLLAIDRHGPNPGVAVDPQMPYFGSSIEYQLEHIIDVAEEICSIAGTSLQNLLRLQHFHTNLNEFYPACQVWQRRFPELPLPISALRVPGPLPVPECTVMVDMWVYVPNPH